MFAFLRRNAIGLLALFVALAGTAYALERNSVRSRHIVNGQVKPNDLAAKAKFADVEVEVTGPSQADNGGVASEIDVTHQVTITNNGPATVRPSVLVSTDLDPGAAVTSSGNACIAFGDTGMAICTPAAPLAPGQSRQGFISSTVPACTAADSVFTRAELVSTDGDLDADNDSGIRNTLVTSSGCG